MTYARSLKGRYRGLKYRCSKKGIKLTLSLEDFSDLVDGKSCTYCNNPINHTYGSGLDRKDNSKGYTKSNAVPCCATCNSIKGDKLSYEEMMICMGAIRAYRSIK